MFDFSENCDQNQKTAEIQQSQQLDETDCGDVASVDSCVNLGQSPRKEDIRGWEHLLRR